MNMNVVGLKLLGSVLQLLGFFSFFLDFSVQIGPDTKFRPMKNILYTILSVTSFSINYSKKTHNSRLR